MVIMIEVFLSEVWMKFQIDGGESINKSKRMKKHRKDDDDITSDESDDDM